MSKGISGQQNFILFYLYCYARSFAPCCIPCYRVRFYFLLWKNRLVRYELLCPKANYYWGSSISRFWFATMVEFLGGRFLRGSVRFTADTGFYCWCCTEGDFVFIRRVIMFVLKTTKCLMSCTLNLYLEALSSFKNKMVYLDWNVLALSLKM